MTSSAKKLLAIASLLLAATILLYFRNLLGGETFTGRDHLPLVTPAREFLGQSLAAGRIPQWWEGIDLGSSFAANPMYGTFYPLAWFTAIAPGSLGVDLGIALHVFLLGLGVACFSLRLGALPGGATVAGVVAMSCGYTASMAVNGVPLMTLAWLPWVAWATDVLAHATDRRGRVRAAMVFAAIFAGTLFSGDPAGAVTAGLLSLVVATAQADHRKVVLAYMAVAALASLLLAAVVLLPAYHLLGEGNRAGGIDFADASVWSMHPLRFVEWIWPQAFGDSSQMSHNLAAAFANSSQDEGFGSGWSISLFFSLPALLMVAAAGSRKLAWASLIFVVLALGSYTPIYGWYRALFLPEQLIRYPERHLAGAIVLWSALSGVGFSKAIAGSVSLKALKAWTSAAIVFVLAAAAAWVFSDAVVGRLAEGAQAAGVDAELGWSDAASGGLMASTSLLLLVGILWWRRKARRSRLSYAALVALLLVPLVRESMYAQPVISRSIVEVEPAILSPLMGGVDSGPGLSRIYRHETVNPYVGDSDEALLFASRYHTAFPNTATSHGFAYAIGYGPARSSRLDSTWGYSNQFGGRLLKLYDIEFAYLDKSAALAGEMEIVNSILVPHLVLAKQRERRPRAFVAERWRNVAGQEQVLKTLFAETIDLNSIVLVGGDPEPPKSDEHAALAPCAIESTRPEMVTLHCDSAKGGYAVLLDAWAPGWSATVDGEARKIHIADSVVRAVRISGGKHTVVFEYHTPGLAAGAWLSLLAWFCLLGGFVLLRFRRQQ